MTDMERASIYVRGKGAAIAAQIAACKQYIAEQGWTAFSCFEDIGAMPAHALPPGLTALCDHVRVNGVPHVVVPHLDRLGRKPEQYRRSREAIEGAGAKIRYAQLTVFMSEEMPGNVYAVRIREEIIATLRPGDEGGVDWYPKDSDTPQFVTYDELKDRLYEFGGDVFYVDLAGTPSTILPRPKEAA